MFQFQENTWRDDRMEECEDPISKPPVTTGAGASASATAEDWNLKVKDI